MNLLDGIALLLVTNSHSDVVATGYVQTQNRITINFARDSAANIPGNYISKILIRLNLLTLSDDRNVAALNIPLIALRPCFPKIKPRTMKLWDACKKLLEAVWTSLSRGSFWNMKEFRARRLCQSSLHS